ncbi:hypothetical protein, partial [Brucella melitensis]|uniref:hypothetical protein n=1 Tax=Brucella melitensis TaxID=29459 RepID=UPI001AEEBEBA
MVVVVGVFGVVVGLVFFVGFFSFWWWGWWCGVFGLGCVFGFVLVLFLCRVFFGVFSVCWRGWAVLRLVCLMFCRAALCFFGGVGLGLC